MGKQLLIGTFLLVGMTMSLRLSAEQSVQMSEERSVQVSEQQPEQPRPIQTLRRAETLTTKGFIDKSSTFDPDLLDSLVKTDKFVMLISSYEGCTPCEWLRVSDVFNLYPISPYYTDFMLNAENQTVPYTFMVSGFPTCMIFDRSGEIIATTVGGGGTVYGKLDRIVAGERFSDHRIPGIPDVLMLPFLNVSHKANAAFMRGEMENVYIYATKAMAIFPNLYNRYLLYRYYLSKDNIEAAEHYRTLILTNVSRADEYVFRNLLIELRGDEGE